MTETTATKLIDLTTVSPKDTDAQKHFVYQTLYVADRANQVLGKTALSPAALKNETVDLYALQQLALLYAGHLLDKTDWIEMNRYVAQLAVSECAQTTWRWQAMDLMSFALNDYLADVPNAGDDLLRELVTLTRQGAPDRLHDIYRRREINVYDDLHSALVSGRLDRGDTLDDLCAAVVTLRSHEVVGQRTTP